MEGPVSAPKRICLGGSGETVVDSVAPSAEQGFGSDASFSDSQHGTVETNSKFSGLDLHDVLVIELCAGTARLTKTIRAHGMRGLAVDKSKDRGCGTDIMILDLTKEHDLQILLQLIRSEAGRIALIFISPPCGTASKARERHIAHHLLAGKKQPVPLRSQDKPDQKDGLSGLDKVKTEMANQLYDAVTQIILECNSLDLWVMVENPKNSLYWSTTFALKYIQSLPTYWVDFHNCAHGGKRDKLTRLWTNKPWAGSLQLFCDKQHQHSSWKPKVVNGRLTFPTAEEAAYPWLFCERVSNLVQQMAVDAGCSVTSTLQEQIHGNFVGTFQRYVFDALPRSSKLKPLVAEYGHYWTVAVNPQNLSAVPQLLHTLPKGSKLVSRHLMTWGNFRVEMVDEIKHDSWPDWAGQHDGQTGWGAEHVLELCKFGMPSDPITFVHRALKAGHPKDLTCQISEVFRNAILANFHKPPSTSRPICLPRNGYNF